MLRVLLFQTNTFFKHVHIQTFDPTSRLLARTLSSASSSSYYRERLKCYTHPGLELLHLLLASLHGDLLSFIQAVLQVFDGLFHVLLHPLQMSAGVSFHFLLQPQSLIPAASLSFKRALQGVDGPLQVSFALLHLFILLSQFTLHVSLDLVELKLSS
uniref:Uncharacterized protein n=1 Tax=Oreochromis aureus TaxID=47969 RepID=A0A668U5U8_OREAU